MLEHAKKTPGAKSRAELVVRYLTLRRLIGWLGISLPPLVWGIPVAGWAVWRTPADFPQLRATLSDYYASASRDVFVGVLFATGCFLAAYRGYACGVVKIWRFRLGDNQLTNVAAVCAFGVALFPVTSEYLLVRQLHLCFAAFLFLSFALISDKLFTLGNSPNNWIYRACARGIVACVVAIGGVMFVPELEQRAPRTTVFFLEAVLLLLFGISWLTKGEQLGSDVGRRLRGWLVFWR